MAIGAPKPPVALIAGPTASGKSALAIALAERTNGVVINADSAQIYRDLPILSAAPNEDDRKRAEHQLYNIRDGADPCSAAEWAQLARAGIAEIHAQGRLPILVGGTGLYLRTLLDGIAPIPSIDPKVRYAVREADVAANRRELASLDPEAAARLNEADTTRIARALEVVKSTGRTLKDWQSDREGGIGDQVELQAMILLPPRDWLYERCNERFSAMIGQGAVEEVKRLLDRELDAKLPVMRAIGVREIAAHVKGDCSLEDAVSAGRQATRNYAKRQYTWFAHQPPSDWPRWLEPLTDDLAPALEVLGAQP
jgi:tRNA dimethylallyltransferase